MRGVLDEAQSELRRAIGHFLMWWFAVLGACFLWIVPPWGVLLAVIVVGSIVVGYHLAHLCRAN